MASGIVLEPVKAEGFAKRVDQLADPCLLYTSLFLTTECVIVDKPEEKAPAMPGGGMDDY